MNPRKKHSAKFRLANFAANNGLCHLCGGKITVVEAWELEHVTPLAMGGEDGGDNLRPAHVKCHKAKTKQDVAEIAKAKRREAFHKGAKKPRGNWPKRQKPPKEPKLTALPFTLERRNPFK